MNSPARSWFVFVLVPLCLQIIFLGASPVFCHEEDGKAHLQLFQCPSILFPAGQSPAVYLPGSAEICPGCQDFQVALLGGKKYDFPAAGPATAVAPAYFVAVFSAEPHSLYEPWLVYPHLKTLQTTILLI